MNKLLLVVLSLLPFSIYGQDSTKVLNEVEVRAYRYNRLASEVPVSIGVLQQRDFERFDNTSLLPAINATPGVRMEERSPGSFRFSIRGSLIRSPFGVRNVKVYWNALPLTDGGGNTYINILDPVSIGGAEIIRGPGGSLYGANTGGVVLFRSRSASATELEASTLAGSYGLRKAAVSANFSKGGVKGSVTYAHQGSDGYRAHTASRRDVVNADWSTAMGESTVLSATVIASDVFYETPGGLNRTEFEKDPRQARPAAGIFRGAEEQKASVRNQSIFGGVTLEHDWNPRWSTELGLFSSYNDFENFAIRNYEHRYETNIGARLENGYAFGSDGKGGRLSFGGEAVYLISPIRVSENNSGTQGARQVSDDLTSAQYLLFAQAEFFLPAGFNLTAGASSNYLHYTFDRIYPVADNRTKSFNAVVTPRVALLKKVGSHVSLFVSASRGFSPPTLAEVRPSTNAFNEQLQAESGTSYEAGAKAAFGDLTFEASAYRFNLRETIVLQRVVDGAEFFINAGETMQKGIEAAASWKASNIVSVWSSYTYNHYRFRNYSRYDQPSGMEQDYSGNKMTGTPPTMLTLGLDVKSPTGLYGNMIVAYTDHIPLNDANTEFAKDYWLGSVKIGFRKTFRQRHLMDVFAGVNNVLDSEYSLGNDLNAVNGRYYNLAPGRNFFLGLKVNLRKK